MKQKFIYFLILSLTLLSTFLPTSINGSTAHNFLSRNGIICFSLLLILFFMLNEGKINKKILISGSLILLSLFIATVISPFSEVRAGALLFYASFVLITLTDYSKLRSTNYVKIIQIISIPIFIFSFLTIKANPNFRHFLVINYSAYYDELVNHMFSVGKPVTFFASHSIAGFIYFIFFYINFEHAKINKSIISSIISVGYLFLLFYLNSVTSLILLVISLSYIIISFMKSRTGYIVFSIVLVILVLFNYDFLTSKIQLLSQSLNNSFASSSNGFLSRYSQNQGVLNYNIEYIKNHPFRPIGFSYSPEFRFVDSGFIEYALRGGIILMISMYYSLYKFFMLNLVNKKQALFLFIFFIAFELGFAGLVAPRIVYLLPVIVGSLNSISNKHNIKKPNPSLD